MTQGSLRRVVMYLMLLGHVAAIFIAPALIANFNDALSVSVTLLPITAAVTMFIVQFHQENFFGAKTDQLIVSRDAAVLTIILSSLSVISIIGVIYFYYIGQISTIEVLQRSVGLIDTAIIVYLILL
jgi:hypothetical protein